MRKATLQASVATLVCLTLGGPSFAAIITIDATDRGWYGDTRDHSAGNHNYTVGDLGSGVVYRNFFVFDLAGVTDPIVSAELHAQSTNYNSSDSTEQYTLFDVSTPISTLMATSSGPMPVFNDLGTGNSYGGKTFSASDANTTVNILLNPTFLADANAANGLLALGGAITTLDASSNSEFIFGFTDGSPLSFTQLVLTTVPDPATLGLLAVGVMTMILRRRRSRLA